MKLLIQNKGSNLTSYCILLFSLLRNSQLVLQTSKRSFQNFRCRLPASLRHAGRPRPADHFVAYSSIVLPVRR